MVDSPLDVLQATAVDEIEVAFAIARHIEVTADLAITPTRLQRAAFDAAVAAQVHGARSVADVLAALMEMGFGRAAIEQVHTQHSHLPWVFEHRCGLPIVLAAVVLSALRSVGIRATGINHPGHFLVLGDHSEGNFSDGMLIDPAAMALVSEEDRSVVEPATPLNIAQRMLNNLKALSVAQRAWQQFFAHVDVQLALAHNEPELRALLHFERGETWLELGAVDAARVDYDQCLNLSEDARLGQRVSERIAELGAHKQTLH